MLPEGIRKLDLERLRRETSDDHAAVEGAMPLMKPNLSRREYGVTLQSLHCVVAWWETIAVREAPDWIQALLDPRKRLPMLERDLDWLKVRYGKMQNSTSLSFDSDAALLGAMYVMEGSTLGGQLIARHLEISLKFDSGNGYSFFQGHGSRTGPLWREFCETLRTRVSDRESDRAVEAARRMFQMFRIQIISNAAVRQEQLIEDARGEFK
jgi:heme oxygenase